MESPSVTVADLAWISGYWISTDGDNRIEEIWSRAAGDTMCAAFRWIRNEHVLFYEFIIIEPDPQFGLVLRLKHFNAGLKGWETQNESVEFIFENLDSKTVSFAGYKDGEMTGRLVYHLANEDRLIVTLQNDPDDIESDQNMVFRFQRS